MKEYKTTAVKFKLSMEKSDFKIEKICTSADAAKYARQFYFEDLEIYESFFIILLNNANHTIGYAKISQGGINSTTVDPIIILKIAMDSLAKGLILVHNHPSGNNTPSKEDRDLTSRIQSVCKLLDIKVLDHMILTAENYYSFADHGII